MPTLQLEELGKHGIVNDLEAVQTPFEQLGDGVATMAWNSGKNVRMDQGRVVSFLGHESEATPAFQPYFINGFQQDANHFWVYLGLTGARAFDGTTHHDISPSTVFSGAATDLWTHTLLNDNVVVNNFADSPHYWDMSTSSNFEILPGWDNSNWKAQAMRSFKGFLIALGVTLSGTSYRYRIKWSDEAAAGGLPTSWDATDATTLAGERDIGDTDSRIVDGLPLRDVFIIYSENQTHGLQFIGGTRIFRTYAIAKTSGLLSKRCVVPVRTFQAAMSDGDLVLVDGQNVRSIANRRMREFVFRSIDQDNYLNSFVFSHPVEDEVWFCFPQAGNTSPNIAAIWNYDADTWSVRDLPANTYYLGRGLDIADQSTFLWSDATMTWAEITERWSERTYNITQDIVIGGDSNDIFRFDNTGQFDGVDISSNIVRNGLKFADGDVATIHQIRPRMTGPQVTIEVGSQMNPTDPITWQSDTFDPDSDYKADFRSSGRYHSIRISSESNEQWTLEAMEIDYEGSGRR